MRSRVVFAVVGWLAVAAAAVLAGQTAVQVINDSITGTSGEVLSPAEVSAALSASPTAGGPAASPAGSPTGSPAAPGGTVVAECTGATAHLVSWAPAQGFGTKQADREPDDHVQVTFEGSRGRVEVDVRCAGGQPDISWERDD